MPNENVANGIYGDASHFWSKENNYEVQRTNHFELVLNLEDAHILDHNDQEHIRLSVKSVTAPKISAEPIELKHGNDRVKVAAAPTYEDLTITLYDTVGRDQLDILQSWFNKVFDKDKRTMGLVSAYKASGVLYMYSPDCSIIRAWDLDGVWPKSFGTANEFTYDSAEAQNITLDLSVDRYRERIQKK